MPPQYLLFRFNENIKDCEERLGSVTVKISSSEREIYCGQIKTELDIVYLFNEMHKVTVEVMINSDVVGKEVLTDVNLGVLFDKGEAV